MKSSPTTAFSGFHAPTALRHLLGAWCWVKQPSLTISKDLTGNLNGVAGKKSHRSPRCDDKSLEWYGERSLPIFAGTISVVSELSSDLYPIPTDSHRCLEFLPVQSYPPVYVCQSFAVGQRGEQPTAFNVKNRLVQYQCTLPPTPFHTHDQIEILRIANQMLTCLLV